MATVEDVKMLFAEFPREAISWRAQSLTKDGDKAMALGYIDARDVMDRLDEVIGACDWQDRYEFHGARTICYLSIRVEGEWITKADGAGDSDVEAEKGAISDALKRAAVKWGVGRYLYSLKSPWVPCETYTNSGGKKVWKSWTQDPWSLVKGMPRPIEGKQPAKPAPKPAEPDPKVESLYAELSAITKMVGLTSFWKDNNAVIKAMSKEDFNRFTALKDKKKAELDFELQNLSAG